MSVTYYKTSAQPAFNVAVTSGLPVWENPIPALNEKTVFRQTFVQTAASYAPLALDTVYPAAGSYGVPSSPTYYLVAEQGQTDLGGGMMQWDRVYARIPTAWSEGEEFAYTFPPLAAYGSASTYSSITNIQDSSENYLVSSALAFTSGDQIYISVSYARGGITYFVGQYTTAIDGTSGTNALIPGILPGSGSFSSISGVINREFPWRVLGTTQVVASQIVYEYALAATSQLDAKLPIIKKFNPIQSNGSDISFDINATTRPTNQAYVQLINIGAQIVAQDSIRRRWLGNIYERQTRYIPAR